MVKVEIIEDFVSNEDNQNGSIACAVEVPVSGQADMDDMWMTRGANKTNFDKTRIKLELEPCSVHYLRHTKSTLNES